MFNFVDFWLEGNERYDGWASSSGGWKVHPLRSDELMTVDTPPHLNQEVA